MTFDWQSFCESNSIEFIDSGPNVKRGNINIHCPLCGSRDPSKHMGLNLETGAWGCWRDSEHRGKNPVRLIAALINCSYETAREMVTEAGASYRKPFDEIRDRLKRMDEKRSPLKHKRFEVLRWPKEFRCIHRKGIRARFFRYLESRGFPACHVKKLAKLYQLRCALTGDWENRIVLPIFLRKKLVGWTCRSLYKGDNVLRYLTYPDSETTKRLVFNYDQAAKGGKVLVIVEGPLDCLKFDWYARKFDIRAVATMGTGFTDEQVVMIEQLAKQFSRTVVLFDPGALKSAHKLAKLLPQCRPLVMSVPPGVEDPGAMTAKQCRNMARKIITKFF